MDVASGRAGAGAALLDWYDGHARILPWRVPPAGRRAGLMPDPYRVWLSEVMLQQTTVAAVRGYYARFTTRWPDVGALAGAADAAVMAEWAGLGYYARARNLIACARCVDRDHGGVFPDTEAALLRLPGIGRYTAAAIAAIAFDRPATVVDGNVERVVARLFAVATPLPAAKPELTALAGTLTPARRPGDHAQAMMDLGATICTPRRPACAACPLRAACRGQALGLAAELPRKTARPPRPTRRGIAWVGTGADGAVLLEERPARGLLGGMLGWPTSDWLAESEGGDVAGAEPPAEANWRRVPGEVRHTFTHFHLVLRVMTARLPSRTRPSRGRWVPRETFRPADLPTLMRKVHDLASASQGAD